MSGLNKVQRDAFAARLEKLINESELTQVATAEKMGYESSNVITMIKRSTTRMAVDKVPTFAQVMVIDVGELGARLACYLPARAVEHP